jgi:hypothetical protein
MGLDTAVRIGKKVVSAVKTAVRIGKKIHQFFGGGSRVGGKSSPPSTPPTSPSGLRTEAYEAPKGVSATPMPNQLKIEDLKPPPKLSLERARNVKKAVKTGLSIAQDVPKVRGLGDAIKVVDRGQDVAKIANLPAKREVARLARQAQVQQTALNLGAMTPKQRRKFFKQQEKLARRR